MSLALASISRRPAPSNSVVITDAHWSDHASLEAIENDAEPFKIAPLDSMWLNGQFGASDPVFSYAPVRSLGSGHCLLDRLWLLVPEDHHLNEVEVLKENHNQNVPPRALTPLLERWQAAKTAALAAEAHSSL